MTVSNAAGSRRVPLLLCVLAVLAAGLAAWWGVWHGGYVFDDHPAIEHNAPLAAGDGFAAAFAPPHHPLANRPAATWSLVVDFVVWGPDPFGPHLGNLVLHLLNGVLVLLLARHTLAAPALGARFASGRGERLAVAIAMLWVAHPLGADAVAYATQRSTLLAATGLLGALLFAARAHAAASALRWRGWSVAAMALAMASKEDAVVGPLLLLGYERAFFAADWRSLRDRLGFLLASAATWLVLVGCVAAGPANATVGFATEPRLTALDWLCTQAAVVLHYLRLTIWPWPQRAAYDTDYVRSLAPAILPGLLVLAVLVATQLQWRRRPWWAWLGLWCFLLLAPSSTLLPIRSEVAAERRMYLPMLLTIVAMVAAGGRLLRGRPPAFGIAATLLAVLGLGVLAQQQAAVYRDEATLWADAYAKRTVGSRSHLAAQILGNHATMLLQQGRTDEALPLFDAMVQCEAITATQQRSYAVSLQIRGRGDEALAIFERVAAAAPDDAEAQAFYGISLVLKVTAGDGAVSPQDPLARRAEQVLRAAVALQPSRRDAWERLGFLLLRQERWSDAEQAYAHATALSTAQVEPFVRHAELLRRLGRKQEIGPLFERLLQDARHAQVAAQLRSTAAQLMR